MAIEAVCACGARQSAPDAWAGRELRCSSCGERFRVPGAPAAHTGPKVDLERPKFERPSRGGSGVSPVILVFLVLVVLGGIGGVANMGFRAQRERMPIGVSPRETEEERRRTNVEGFAAEPIVPGTDEAKVREALEAFTAAQGRGDGDAFTRLMHFPRMLAEVEAFAPLDQIKTKKDEQDFYKGLALGMGQTVKKQAGTPLAWTSIEVARVRFHASRPEAEAFARVRLQDTKVKFRFWMIKDGGAWKVFDYESTQEGVRVTNTLASLFTAAFNPAKAKAIERASAATREALEHLNAGNSDRALATLRAAQALKPPDRLLEQLDVQEGMILTGLGKHKEALAIFDRVIARRKDLPLAHHGRGQALFTMARYEEAAAAEGEYLAQAGDDADALIVVGRSLEFTGKTREAIEALRKGAACDDEEWACRYHLARLLVGEKKHSEALPLFREACRRAPPNEEAAANAVGLLLQAKAWEPLLELSRDAGMRHSEAVALRHLGRPAEAEKAIREGIAKDGPDSYRRELIRALAAQGRDADATAAVEGLAQDDPDAWDVRLYRALVHAAAKRDGEARRELHALLKASPYRHSEIEEEPAFEGARKEKGLAEALGRAREKVEYDQAAEGKSEDDDWAAVLELSRKRLERAPDDGDAWEWSGRAHRELKRFAEAEKALRTALEKLPEGERASAREELGLALAQLGRTDEALAIAEAIRADRKAAGLRLRAFALALAKRDDEAAKAIGALLGEFKGWFWAVESDPAFESVRKRPEVAEMIRQAKPVPKK